MIWKQPHQCVSCGFKSYKGERIHGQYVCEDCEREMIETLAKDMEDTEWAEVNRITGNGDNSYRVN
jgi:predicted Zn-ribbon and HTH transcriptional regulator